MKKLITPILILTTALVFSTVSLIHKYRISPEGFFTFYKGPIYVSYGWPWGFVNCFDDGSCILIPRQLILNFTFWIIPSLVVVVGVLFAIKSYKKNVNK